MGFVAAAVKAVTLTLHPAQTLRVASLHVGEVIVCHTASDTIRWKATAASVHTSSVVWDKRLQLTIKPHGGKTTLSCQNR